jgi:hypothetical protein
LVDQDGKLTDSYYRTKPFSVELELESFTRNELILSVVVINDMGVNVLHLSHYDSPTSMVINKPGNYRVYFTIPCLPLFPGSYHLTLGIHYGSEMEPVDVVKNVLPFSVEEPLDSPRPIKTPANLFMSWAPSAWSCDYLGRNE